MMAACVPRDGRDLTCTGDPHALALGIRDWIDRRPGGKAVDAGQGPGRLHHHRHLGIAGSLLATWVGQNVFGWYQEGQSAGFITSVVGAIVLLLIYHLLFRPQVAR